jgi:hypothetical protein
MILARKNVEDKNSNQQLFNSAMGTLSWKVLWIRLAASSQIVFGCIEPNVLFCFIYYKSSQKKRNRIMAQPS